MFDFVDDILGWMANDLKTQVDKVIASEPDVSMNDVPPAIISFIEAYAENPDAPEEPEVIEKTPSELRHIVKEFGAFLIRAAEGPSALAPTQDLIHPPSKLDTQVCETFESAVGTIKPGDPAPENDLQITGPDQAPKT